MFELLTPHCCHFGGLFPGCCRSGYELFVLPATPTKSATCELTTLLILCVCDDQFWGGGNHPCLCRCSWDFLICHSFVRDRLAGCSIRLVPSHFLPDVPGFSCAFAGYPLSVSVVCCVPYVAQNLGNLQSVPSRERGSSWCHGVGRFCRTPANDLGPLHTTELIPSNSANFFRICSFRVCVCARLFVYSWPPMAERYSSGGHSRSHTATARLRQMSERFSTFNDRIKEHTFGRCPATLDGNWKGGDVQDRTATETSSHRLIRKPRSQPWSAAEIHARGHAEVALEPAKACAAVGNVGLAIQFCLGGLCGTWGFTRPFAIRDQIVDFMRRVDPDGSIRKKHT
jgi:hypothetical protein